MIYRDWEKVVGLVSFQTRLKTKSPRAGKKPPKGLEELTLSCFQGRMGLMKEILIPRQTEDELQPGHCCFRGGFQGPLLPG